MQGPIDAIPKKSRRTYNAGDYVNTHNVSIRVTGTDEIISERAMYWEYYGWPRVGGHNSIVVFSL